MDSTELAATNDEADSKGTDDTLPAAHPKEEPAPGALAVFTQRYEVEDEIARGGMGAVLAAKDLSIRREIAVKVMLSEQADHKTMARFIEEAQVQGQLEHPNICPIYDLGFDELGHPYFAMKRVRGRSLREVLRGLAAGKLDPEEYGLPRLLEIFTKICDAVAFAHSRGVVHRDLKPANVMIGEFGEVLVMDWGLAKVVGSREKRSPSISSDRLEQSLFETRVGSIMGSPRYMAPEQAAGDVDRIDARSDVYALGAILYAILTLLPPVEGSDVQEAVDRTIVGDIRPPSQRTPDRPIPSDLEACAMKALCLEPEERYQSATELREEVTRFLNGRALTVAQYSLAQLFAKWVARNKALAVTLAVSALLLAGVLGAFMLHLVQSGRQDRLRVAEERIARGDALAMAGRYGAAKQAYVAAERGLAELGEETAAARLGSWDVERVAPDPIYAFGGGGAVLPRDRRFWNGTLAISEDGGTVISGGKNGGLLFWDALTGRMLGSAYERSRGVFTMSPDGRIYFGSGSAVHILDLKSRSPIRAVPLPVRPGGMGFEADTAPDRVWLATAKHEVVLLDLQSAKIVTRLAGHQASVRSIEVSPDGTRLASLDDRYALRLWDTKRGEELAVVSRTASLGGLAFSPDGSHLAAAEYDGDIRLFAVDHPKKAPRVVGKVGAQVAGLRFSPDGDRLIAGGANGTGVVIEVATGRVLAVLDRGDPTGRHRDVVYGNNVLFMPAGDAVVTAGRGGAIEVWPVGGPKAKEGIEIDNVRRAVFTPDGETFAVTSRWRLSVFDTDLGVRDPSFDQCEKLDGGGLALVDSETLAVGRPGFVDVVDLRTGQRHRWLETGTEVPIVWLARTTDRLFGAAGGRLYAWDDGGTLVREMAVEKHAFIHAAGAYLITGDDRTLSIFDASTLKAVGVVPLAASLRGQAISRNGRVAAIGLVDGRVQLVELGADPKSVALLAAHDGAVRTLSFSPDGHYLLTGGDDRTVRILDLHAREEIRLLRSMDARVSVVAFSPDGDTLLSATDHALRLDRIGSVLEGRASAPPRSPSEVGERFAEAGSCRFARRIFAGALEAAVSPKLSALCAHAVGDSAGLAKAAVEGLATGRISPVRAARLRAIAGR